MTRYFLGGIAFLAIAWIVLAVGSIVDPPAIWHIQAKVATVLKLRS